MDPAAAKLIGAGLASIALVGAGVGIGTIFGNYLQGALRNPSAAPGQFANLLLGFALGGSHRPVRPRGGADHPVRVLALPSEVTGEPIMPQLNPLDWAPQLIWLVITFGILYLLMKQVALPRIGSVIEARHARIAGDLEAADKLRRETQEAIAAYEQALAEAKARAHAIAQEGAQQAESRGRRRARRARARARRAIGGGREAHPSRRKTSALKEVNAVAGRDGGRDRAQADRRRSRPSPRSSAAVAAARKD